MPYDSLHSVIVIRKQICIISRSRTININNINIEILAFTAIVNFVPSFFPSEASRGLRAIPYNSSTNCSSNTHESAPPSANSQDELLLLGAGAHATKMAALERSRQHISMRQIARRLFASSLPAVVEISAEICPSGVLSCVFY